jgi:MFS family permease
MARELVSGFPALFRTLDLSLVVALFFSQGVVRGALNVFLAVAAFDLLGAGESGVGFLTAALGVGGIAGAFFALSLTGRHLAAPFAAGLVLWGLPIVGIGGVPHFSAALVFLAVVGAGNSVADVAGFTLMQRLIPDELLQRALGVFWGLAMLSIGIGSIAVAGLISAVGIRWSLVATGAFLTLLTVLSSRRLATLDRSVAAPTDRLELLERVPMFAPLSLAAKDRLASALVPLSVPAGVDIIREGEPGDRFYMLVEGEADVFKDGEKTTARTSGDYFGEIALLRDVPRTATVRARSRLRLYALDRDPFLAAVTGHAAGRDAGEAVVEERLPAPPTS